MSRYPQPALQVIVRTAGKEGFHPRPVTTRYAPKPDEIIQWWEFCGIGWPAVRGEALKAGLSQINRIRPKGMVLAAWCVVGKSVAGLTIEYLDQPSTQLTEEIAISLVASIGLPTAAQIAHQKYTPVKDPRPPGREGAARRLARTGLPPSVTAEVARDILAMFERMDGSLEKQRHIHFWKWATKERLDATAG